ncbi:two-component system, OmpR family, sensor histidine kinase AdeS [Ectopseudomonas composti]|jgi:two-component system sensor histidine kinase AdeS|uniref:histidine kinase n=1 Tax=Ectopseudomonas composti TaxID=658457 RepID=A0A1I5N5M4_9GAMM|nr:ATP-binding protein [Pseudomonas composti]SFP17215.1 two-component system, OmpR family, sensor histidine kinase AdeS [Pseudomonas composti]
MKPTPGLRRQIIQSLAVMALGIICLSVFGTYLFYAFAVTYLPGSISDTMVPSRLELVWITCTIIAALSMAVLVAVRLSRRLISPLNAVAHSLREVAEGKLDARAPLDDQATGETAQLVRDFNAMAERLQSVTREREFWNAAIAHELRTPLTILRGRLQGLAEGVFSPSNELFEGLLHHVESLSRLIEDLRVLSLNESGHLEVQRVSVRLADELGSVLQTFATPLAEKGFDLREELDAELLVECDAVRIRQALMALLENALRHADPGNLKVRLERVGDDCQLSVEDDGPGIDSALATDIFEAFRRGDPSRSRKSGGSGLGLAVVKAIAEAHGGQAYCQASANGGSRFVLSWPLQKPE